MGNDNNQSIIIFDHGILHHIGVDVTFVYSSLNTVRLLDRSKLVLSVSDNKMSFCIDPEYVLLLYVILS